MPVTSAPCSACHRDAYSACCHCGAWLCSSCTHLGGGGYFCPERAPAARWTCCRCDAEIVRLRELGGASFREGVGAGAYPDLDWSAERIDAMWLASAARKAAEPCPA